MSDNNEAQEHTKARSQVCLWRQDDQGLWWSDCGGGVAAEFGDVVVAHTYCPKCGRELEVERAVCEESAT